MIFTIPYTARGSGSPLLFYKIFFSIRISSPDAYATVSELRGNRDDSAGGKLPESKGTRLRAVFPKEHLEAHIRAEVRFLNDSFMSFQQAFDPLEQRLGAAEMHTPPACHL